MHPPARQLGSPSSVPVLACALYVVVQAESIAKAAQEDKEAELARRAHSRKIMEETMQANIDAKKHKQELV